MTCLKSGRIRPKETAPSEGIRPGSWLINVHHHHWRFCDDTSQHLPNFLIIVNKLWYNFDVIYVNYVSLINPKKKKNQKRQHNHHSSCLHLWRSLTAGRIHTCNNMVIIVTFSGDKVTLVVFYQKELNTYIKTVTALLWNNPNQEALLILWATVTGPHTAAVFILGEESQFVVLELHHREHHTETNLSFLWDGAVQSPRHPPTSGSINCKKNLGERQKL